MQLSTVIENIKTELEGWSWTSASGGGTTSFDAVYTTGNLIHDDGFPFAIVKESNAEGSTLSNVDIEVETTISIFLCVNWPVIDKSDEILQREEGQLRLREAWDYAKTIVYTRDFEDTIGVDFSYRPSMVTADNDESNLLRYEITLTVKEIVQR